MISLRSFKQAVKPKEGSALMMPDARAQLLRDFCKQLGVKQLGEQRAVLDLLDRRRIPDHKLRGVVEQGPDGAKVFFGQLTDLKSSEQVVVA